MHFCNWKWALYFCFIPANLGLDQSQADWIHRRFKLENDEDEFSSELIEIEGKLRNWPPPSHSSRALASTTFQDYLALTTGKSIWLVRISRMNSVVCRRENSDVPWTTNHVWQNPDEWLSIQQFWYLQHTLLNKHCTLSENWNLLSRIYYPQTGINYIRIEV